MDINYKMISLMLHAGYEVQVAIIAKNKIHSAMSLRIYPLYPASFPKERILFFLGKTVGFLEKQ